MGLHSDNPTSAHDIPSDLPPDETANEASNNQSITVDKSVAAAEDNKEAMNKFWAYVKAKMEAAQEWANRVIAGLKYTSKPSKKPSESFEQGDVPS